MILALDCSTRRGSVALVGEAVREVSFDCPRGRGGQLYSALEELLDGSPRLERVVVGIGPGGYNGIRSAIAAGWGIARARGIPLVAVSSLLALGTGTYAAAGDARRDQFYHAEISDGTFNVEPSLVGRDELIRRIRAGKIFVPEPIDGLPEATVGFPGAVRLAELGAGRAPADGIPEPIYLKAAHITVARTGRK